MISRDDVIKLAALARLSLPEEEIESCRRELSQIIDYFNAISELDTEGVLPLMTPTELEIHLREDRVQSGGLEDRDMNLSHTLERVGNLFKVPPFV